jgi:hypothetical protein
MPLDRISSATPYAALALVQAATANAPRPESFRAMPAAEPVTPDVNALALRVNGASANVADGATALPTAFQAREDRLGQRFDARA